MAFINYIEKHLTTFTVKYHMHSFWEIIYVTEGAGTIKTNDNQVIEYKKGETICIPPNVHHTNLSTDGFKNIHFTVEGWTPPFNCPILIPASDSGKDLLNILKLTYRYFHQLPINDPINIALTNSAISFLDSLIHKSEAYNITQVLVHEIINRYTEISFDLDKAYKLIPLSKEHVRKLFVKEHGISPSKFLQQKRITLAKQLLSKKENESFRVNEIAEACGFSDPAYFCRLFKKETGFSPNKFQMKLLKNNKIYF